MKTATQLVDDYGLAVEAMTAKGAAAVSKAEVAAVLKARAALIDALEGRSAAPHFDAATGPHAEAWTGLGGELHTRVTWVDRTWRQDKGPTLGEGPPPAPVSPEVAAAPSTAFFSALSDAIVNAADRVMMGVDVAAGPDMTVVPRLVREPSGRLVLTVAPPYACGGVVAGRAGVLHVGVAVPPTWKDDGYMRRASRPTDPNAPEPARKRGEGASEASEDKR